ncbi:hypothetical protein MNBD_DELTA01-705 [hydrothermal vent metagenome]|uniref:Uncharacterized protein n=1 Tax=hydrothermal vent metagenome TaxID=652676 RepID=A0A3B0QUW5_9ZZZZ
MLSKEDKDRIRAEEIFRSEVQREIQEGQNKKGLLTNLFKFFNSSFGIWFLSAVVLSSALYIYQDIQTTRAVNTQTQLRINKIDTELKERIHGFETTLKTARTSNNLATAIRRLSESESIHSEFLKYSFTGLLQELIFLVPTDEQKELKKVLAIAIKLKKDRQALNRYENARNTDIKASKDKLSRYLNKDFKIRGWRE